MALWDFILRLNFYISASYVIAVCGIELRISSEAEYVNILIIQVIFDIPLSPAGSSGTDS